MNSTVKKSANFPVPRALAIELGKIGSPVVLRYDIARIAWHLYKSRVYDGLPLAIKLDKLDPRIESWLEFAARGGSRKLDATADYDPKFSERWMLSINTETGIE